MSGLSTLTEAMRAFGSAKQLAIAAGCHINTAKNYQLGYTFPDIVGLTRLMARSRAVTDALLRMAGLDDLSLDLETARLTRLLAELHERRQELHAEDLEEATSARGRRPRVADQQDPAKDP
jgi:hypothetical protein